MWFALGLALQGALTGCTCAGFRFVSLEQGSDFRVVDRTWAPYGDTFTIWPFAAEYAVERADYRVRVSVNEYTRPVLAVRAFGVGGESLEIRGPDMGWRHGPRIPPDAEEGSWSFDVLQAGRVIGSEAFDYRIRSRPIACGWDLI